LTRQINYVEIAYPSSITEGLVGFNVANLFMREKPELLFTNLGVDQDNLLRIKGIKDNI